MADMTPLTDILNNDPASATPVQNNFQTIEAYINGTELIRADGTEVMTDDLDMDGNKVVGLADGTAVTDAAALGQVAVGNYEATASGVVCATTPGTVVDTISVTVPSAGMALVAMYGTTTTAGVTFSGGGVSTTITPGSGAAINSWGAQLADNSTSPVVVGLWLVPLSSGANTITLTGVRTNNDFGSGPPTGGTATVNSGFKTAIVGMF